MRVDLLTREYPPQIYGGAGVHVAELTKALRRLTDMRVRCLGGRPTAPGVRAYAVPERLAHANPALGFLAADLEVAADCAGADVVHSHTWYANAAGRVAALLYGIPHVVTLHSLEPRRPWKAEQLGSGYTLSSWMEREAVMSAEALIAVSGAMRDDIAACYPQVPPSRLHVVHNGIDTHDFRPDHDTSAIDRFGIDPGRPVVLHVGRITRQKGLPHLLRAAFKFRRDAQVVLCCGQSDTPELAAETDALIAELERERGGVVRVNEMLDQRTLRQLLTRADVFVCPSLYEPMGIVNLEAMACETAVVATAVGGIPEVVVHGETGLLVPFEQAPDGSGEPLDAEELAADLAGAVNRLLDDPRLAEKFGEAGRRRAVAEFSWERAAELTMRVYRRLRHLRG